MLDIVKLLLLTGLIATLTNIALTDDGVWGQREPGDWLVHDQNITLPRKMALVQQITVNYDPWFIHPVITAIIVQSFKSKDQPDVQIIKGGVGQKKVELRLTTQESKGMRVRVMIYGKKTKK